MDITIDGFHSWMWKVANKKKLAMRILYYATFMKGLVWLLPFLYFGYLLEIYNAYVLYFIYQQVSCHKKI